MKDSWMSENWGCVVGIIVAIVVGIPAFFGIKYWTETRHVDPGNYAVVIYYHSDGSKEVDTYTSGYQYSLPWFSNAKSWEYSAATQTLKIYRSTTEGISPTPDDIYCADSNGVQFSGDLQATFRVAKDDVYTVYSQHPDLPLNADPGTNGVDTSIAGVVVRPILQAAWKNACASRTYTQFEQQEFASVQTDIVAYATPLLKAAGITLITVAPQTVYLPPTLQDSLTAIAKAQADLAASQIAVQTAKNEASALDIYQQEIAKNPALLKLLLIEKILEKWDGHGQIPSYIVNAGS